MEFEHSRFEYYSEFDAVEIIGHSYVSNVGRIASSLKSIADSMQNLDIVQLENSGKYIENNDTELLLTKKPLVVLPIDKNINLKKFSSLTGLPYDILIIILCNLDLKTLFRLRSTSKFFYSICSDKQFFRKLDLQPYWNTVNLKFDKIYLLVIQDKTYIYIF